MTISARPYKNEIDLQRIQAATAEWIAIAGFRGYMNTSDIALRLFNGMRKYDPVEIVRLWEDSDLRIVGWSMIYPAWNGYEALVHPDFRQNQLEMDILDWAEHETIGWLQKMGHSDSSIELAVFDEDTGRITLLEQRGYSRQDHRGTISLCPLDHPIPQSRLPNGFSIRHVQGEQEADKLVALVNDSFGWKLTVEGYQSVMHSPGYRPENEMVVVAPDGRFAASCILLPDTYNRTGMFENVSTGSDFRRLGLATALLYAGMERMRMQGFTTAMVPHHASLGAAAALYRSVGFQPTYKIYEYSKGVFEQGSVIGN